VKFGFPMASMTTIVAWGANSFYEGYEKAGQLEWLDKMLKWSTDYFMAAHKSDCEFVGQIGNGGVDHGFWGRPEEMTMNRPAYSISCNNPGSDLAGETAAALAASSMYFTRRGESSYAAQLLTHARSLFEFADKHRGVYTNAISDAGGFYNSWSGYEDELMWSAAWMALATGESSYADMAEDFYNQFDELQGLPSEFSWDDKTAGGQLLLYQLTENSRYKSNVQAFLANILHGDFTPKGLVWISSSEWGSCRHAGNLAHFALEAAQLGIDSDDAISFAENQINYILGDGGRSYVCGFGNNPPERPHHRASSCPDMPQQCDWNAFNNPGPNPQVLNGALVGGPDHNDNYNDDRGNFVSNEVATDYNAGFQSALAGLNKLFGEGTTSGPHPTAGPTDPPQPTDPTNPTNPTNPPEPQGGSISNPQTGLCLAVDSQDETPHDYSNVKVDSCNEGRAEHWEMDQEGQIKHSSSGHCLDEDQNNQEVELYTCSGATWQKWDIVGKTIVNRHSGRCLDIAGCPDGCGAGTNVWAYDCYQPGNNQQWEFN